MKIVEKVSGDFGAIRNGSVRYVVMRERKRRIKEYDTLKLVEKKRPRYHPLEFEVTHVYRGKGLAKGFIVVGFRENHHL